MSPDAPPRPAAAAVVRAAIFVLPIFSVLVAALVFFGPGARRPALFARVRGLPTEGGSALALRIEVAESLHDIVDAAPARELIVDASASGQTLPTFRGAAGPDGVADVLLSASAPLQGSVALRVASPDGAGGSKLLVWGELALRRPMPAFVELGTIRGAVRGDLAIRVDAARGTMAAPFPEQVRISIAPEVRADLELSGAGMTIAPERVTTDARGAATVTVTPLAHNVELAVAARAGDKSARWEGTLPVVPGAVWLDPRVASGTLSLVSPSPRGRVYVSVWTDQGRVFGAAAPLTRDAFGFFRGELHAPSLPASRVAYAVVAADPAEQGSSTVAWPLPPGGGSVSGPRAIEVLLDGLPAALEHEARRARAARRAGLATIGAAALVCVLLLLMQSRASRRALTAHLAQASADGALPEEDRAKLLGAARERPILHAVLLVALVALGFAMVASLSTFR